MDKSLSDVTEVLRLRPQEPQAWITRACIAAAKGDQEACIADASEAIRLAPDRARAWCVRGSGYNNTGKNDKAIEDFSKALALDPLFLDALIFLGLAWREQKPIEK